MPTDKGTFVKSFLQISSRTVVNSSSITTYVTLKHVQDSITTSQNKSQQEGVNKNDSDLSPDDIAVSPLVHGVVERMRGLTRLIPATDEGNSEISGEKTVLGPVRQFMQSWVRP